MTLEADGGEGGEEEVWPVEREGEKIADERKLTCVDRRARAHTHKYSDDKTPAVLHALYMLGWLCVLYKHGRRERERDRESL